MELRVTDFSGWLFDTVDLMQHTDFFLGMHGAGMTNVYFLPEVRTGSLERSGVCTAKSRTVCMLRYVVLERACVSVVCS